MNVKINVERIVKIHVELEVNVKINVEMIVKIHVEVKSKINAKKNVVTKYKNQCPGEVKDKCKEKFGDRRL